MNDPSTVTEIHRKASDSGHSYEIQLNIQDIVSPDFKTGYHQIRVESSETALERNPYLMVWALQNQKPYLYK